ncbi:MAG: preprotein translocase subunit SecY, partial [Nitrososphaeria archaeon]|nr:preprotein translocase subunit SecY [Nitrososphaeria archaeon]NIN53214.1 preprotein translocase subunit SecY [Nitrososphaeria archaeon]NIQ33670.1 preprotein translocase subunit SecY [Nitrososphaeria archaeon]
LLFIVILTILAVVFATIWVQIGGLSADDVSRQLIDAGMQVPGWRRRRSSISMILGRYIPIMTVIGGIFVGFIAGSTQILGVFGGGIGILLTIDILMQYYQLLMREQIEEIYPSISRVLRV